VLAGLGNPADARDVADAGDAGNAGEVLDGASVAVMEPRYGSDPITPT
jgi:hypothetical protein